MAVHAYAAVAELLSRHDADILRDWMQQQLAELLGGGVGVESTPGEGSIFWVRVPTTAPRLEQLPAVTAHVVSVLAKNRIGEEDGALEIRRVLRAAGIPS